MITQRVPAAAFAATPQGRVAASVVSRLRSRGFEAFLAGGCVRDVVLGETPHDFDVATSAHPEEVQRSFEKVIETGLRFGTVTVVDGDVSIEVTTFRAETEYLDGRRPSKIRFGASLAEDALRRDFTINALFADPATGDVLDHYGGLEDLYHRRVRAVGRAAERFDEDALRLLRCVRFAVRFGATIEFETECAARERPDRLRLLSPERTREELTKMLLGPRPGGALRLLDAFGFTDVILPEVAEMRGVPQPPKFHPEGDVYFHTVDVVERLDVRTLETSLAALFHDVGKTRTLTVSDRIRFHGHEFVSCDLAEARMRRLCFSNRTIDQVLDLIREHIHLGSFLLWRKAKQIRFLERANVLDHLALHRADRGSAGGDLEVSHRALAMMAEAAARPPQPRPLITGRDLNELGHRPGPRFRTILDAVRDEQLEGKLGTRDDALDYVRHKFPLEP